MNLWEFALRFYSDPDVQSACLALQDEHGADVSVVICLLWRAARGESLDLDEITRLDGCVSRWRSEVVVPIRHIRRHLKQQALLPDRNEQEAFRNRIKAVELEAEKTELQWLQNASGDLEGPAETGAAAYNNLSTYLRYASGTQDTPEVVVLCQRLTDVNQ